MRQLCNQGISLTSNSYPKPIPDSSVYECKKRKDDQVQELIPVKKIMGASPLRIDTDKTWLENFKAMDKEIDSLLDALEEKRLKWIY